MINTQLAYVLKNNEIFTHKHSVYKKYSDNLPFCLFHKKNKLFILNVYTQYGIFPTPFFIIKTINLKKNCAVLEPLVPCFHKHNQSISLEHSFCCVKKLFHTSTQITIDLSFFCGFVTFSIPIFECYLQHQIQKKNFCIPYTLLSSMSSQTIWKTNIHNSSNITTLTISYQFGLDFQTKIIIYTKTKSFTLHVLKKQCYSITIKDLTHIKIFTPQHNIYGTITMQIRYYNQKKYYF